MLPSNISCTSSWSIIAKVYHTYKKSISNANIGSPNKLRELAFAEGLLGYSL